MKTIERPYALAAARLRRSAVSTATKWTATYRKSKDGPWGFDRHPWTVEMTDCEEDWCGMKAAQMGFTEVCLNRALFTIDIKRLNVLYIMPSKTPDATDFSADRFDGALELSPHLEQMFSDVKNIGHKRAGSVSLYLRGARSRSGLKSIPAALIVYDEFAEMASNMVTLAEERSSGQTYSQDIRISTPLLPKDNIDNEYTNSSLELFSYNCPHCSQWQILDHDNCFKLCGDGVNDPDIRKSHYFCPNCKTPIPHERKKDYFRHDNTEWVRGKSSYMKRGFRIPQHYSFDLEPWKLARLTFKAQYDVMAEAELWNSKYGLPKETAGARLTGEEYELCKDLTHSIDSYPADYDFIVMGIDVGRQYHIEVWAVKATADWTGDIEDFAASCNVTVINAFTVDDTNDVLSALDKYRPLAYCIDANPETRAAKRITAHRPGQGYRVQYATDRTVAVASHREDMIFAGRSYWLDSLRNRFKKPKTRYRLPIDIRHDHKDHFQSLVKHYSRNKKGDYEAQYLTQGADHFNHAANYAGIAIRATLFSEFGQNVPTKNPF